MVHRTYDITDFKWDEGANSFYGNADNLYECERRHFYQIPFINGRGQFFIKNKISGGFRRFRFERESDINETESIYVYSSDDGIKCEVTIKNIDYEI
jgi:hypothetical protein